MALGNRRDFFKVAAVMALPLPAEAHAAQMLRSESRGQQSASLLRPPDRVTARFAAKQMIDMTRAGQEWTCRKVRVTTEPLSLQGRSTLPVQVSSGGEVPSYLHLRWQEKGSKSLLCFGDAWERAYGDLEWRGSIPERVMPWYFLTFDGERVNGYGVETQPSAFCFWQRDVEGYTLTIDLRNGGEALELGARVLHACTVVKRAGLKGESVVRASRQFCAQMSPHPRPFAGAIFGSNDWNYAYGKNTAQGILRDADLIASLAPSGALRPLVVIDDGWQDATRFPSMADLAQQIGSRHLRPGLWVRPLRADAAAPASWLLPDARFGRRAGHNNLAFDPTVPEALAAALKSVSTAVDWGYGFIKHDFTTWELLGRWGSAMGAEITGPGWHFHDRTRTTAEVIADFYMSIRAAAGNDTVILGCNTVSHLTAGIFDSQRVADDTSGHDWERTRRYGVNGLSQRIAQHRTFYHVDPDCVAITNDVAWKETAQWMDVVARSGTSLFLSPDPRAITGEAKAAMRDAMLLASQNGAGFPVHSTQSTTPTEWQFTSPEKVERNYDWVGPGGVSPFDV